MGKTFSTGLLTDGISQDSSNNIGIGGATSGTNKFEVSGSTKLNGNTAITGSLSITGSATTIGNTTISGSLTVSSSANAIVLPAGQTIGLGTAQIYTGTGGNSGNIFVQGAQTKLYADKVILEAATAAGVEVIGATKLSGSFIVSGSATTVGNTVLSGSLNVSGSITSNGTLTAQTLVVQTITSSVLYSSGSNIFGNSLSNTQTFTGSVGITGSLTLNNIAIPTSASLASTYLPLTGGTLTGALGGTSATFSNTLAVTIGGAGISLTGTVGSNSYYVMDQTPNSGGKRWRFGHTGAVAGFGSFDIYNQTDNITPFSIASTGTASFYGNVGIGGATISSMTAVSGIELVQGSQIASRILANVPQLYISSNVAGDSYAPTYKVNGYATQYRLQGYDGTHVFYTAPSGTAGNAITFTGSLTITPTGNVGIGTTPSNGDGILDVVGFAGTMVTGVKRAASFYSSAAENADRPGVILGYDVAGAGVIAARTQSAGQPLAFWTYNGSSWSEKMRITSGGNVGIGTTSPGFALDVNSGTAGHIINLNTTRTGGGGFSIANNGSARLYLGNANWMGISGESTSSTAISLASAENSAIIFARNAAASVVETMRITSGGDVLVGRTSGGLTNVSGSTITNSSISVEGTSYVFYGNRTTTDGTFMGIRRNNVDVGSISVTTSATAFNTSSDYRLKTDFKEFNALSIIDSITTYDFAWKIDNTRAYGVKAHELKQIVPYVVFGEKDEINEDDSIKPQAVDYSKLVPVLVKAIQELKAENDTLKDTLQRNNIT